MTDLDDATVEAEEGCICGHGPHHHEGGSWPVTHINGPCAERGCACTEFRRG